MLRNNSASSHEKCECNAPNDNRNAPNDNRNVPDDNRNVYRYNREEMLEIRNAPSSSIRPQYLSTDFDNEEGKFEPEKWLEYRWICEGVENRPNTNIKRKEKLKVEVLEGDTTILSPQRRGFSSGCRAASPVKNEAETERLGATKAIWRSGAGFQLKNAGTEYKTSFHRNVGSSESPFIRTRQQNGTFPSSAGNWRSGETFKPNYQKESGQSQRSKCAEMTDEKMPEWLNDGPTSMHDMIELRGFDDDNKAKRDFSQRSKRHSVKLTHQSGISVANEPNENLADDKIDATDWRPSSQIGNDGLCSSSTGGKLISFHKENTDSDVSTNRNFPFGVAENNNSLTQLPLLNGRLPNSDAEFAAIMGILGDADLDSLKEDEIKSPMTKEPTGSRLSRFFTTTKSENSDASCASGNEPLQLKHAIPSSSISDSPQAPTSISVLNKIFSNAFQQSFPSQFLPESHVAPSVQGVLRVEDLERNFQKELIPRNPSTLSAGGDGNLAAGEQFPSNSRQSYLSQQTMKGNPLGDPHQQAHLMNKLNKFARLQNGATDDASRTTEDNLTFPSKISLAPTHHLSGIPLNSQVSSHPVVPPPLSDVTFQAALLRSQYEKAAALHALAANQRSALVSNAQAVDSTALRQALTNIVGNGAMPQSTQTRPLTTVAPTPARATATATGVLPNSFMPTSVMRQMTKNNNTSAAIEEKLRHSNMSMSSTQYNAIKQNLISEHVSVPQKLTGDAVAGNMASKNAANLMTRLALQQQYAQMLAAMQNGLSLNNWQSNAQMTASVRAQALAAHAEHQRQYALAMMRGDFNQAQFIRARFLSHQAASFSSLPNVTVTPHPQHVGTPLVPVQPVVTTAPVPVPQNTQPPPSLTQYKYQNPLEKLLQSAGVPANRGLQPSNKGSTVQTATAASDLPSILSRLPPTANCISVEELEKQFAAN